MAIFKIGANFKGECIYTKEWHNGASAKDRRPLSQSIGPVSEFLKPKTPIRHSQEEQAKLIFGVVFSLRNTVRKLTDEDSFVSFKTSTYRLHLFETPSNLRFVMITDPKLDNMRPVLNQIFASLYVEYVVKNPLSPVEHAGGAGVKNELFLLGLDAFVTSLPGFE